ncbi:hypothetical protein ABT297_15360 [Dactylosporangium sp. NPDC000555]|uniref:hypothetical protein n=1 Tax=Dactylosporangium sp. NPDC000555 TaxID=3154260 RepID=UPI00332AF91D
MSEYGEIEMGHEHGSLEEAHAGLGASQDYQSQYGILEHDHRSIEHEAFENVKHIEYTDAAGNHYQITEYTRYERTEIEEDHTFAAYGQESFGESGFGAAENDSVGFGEVGFGQVHSFGATSVLAGLEGITSHFENFLGSGSHNDNEINDASA